MTYREPAERPLRLWLVGIAYLDKTADNTPVMCHEWIWAKEAIDAIDISISKVVKASRVTVHGQVTVREAWCGEDFAEREIKGPPQEERK